MFFTQDDYKKIQQWLTKNSVKDTEFNEANIPFNGEETITIVQGNQNKKVFLKDLIAQVFNLGISDFVNITDKYDAPNISLEEAIRLIPSRARKEGQVITFLDMEDHWHIYQFKGALNQWNVLDTWEDLFDWEKLIINSILPDEEDLTKSEPDTNGNSYLSLKDREYNPEDFSGLGRVILRKNIIESEDPIYGKVKKNILYQDMINKENTIYEIRYDFNLNGAEITIPEGCVLDFQGGSFSNGIIIGSYTSIKANVRKVFELNIVLKGNWNVEYWLAEWFGAKSDGVTDNTEIFNYIFSMFKNGFVLKLMQGTYVANGIDLSHCKNITIIGHSESLIRLDPVFETKKKSSLILVTKDVDYIIRTEKQDGGTWYRAEGITIRNVGLDGNDKATCGFVCTFGTILYNTTISRCKKNGIETGYHAYPTHIEKCISERNGKHAFYAGAENDSLTTCYWIKDCDFIFNKGYGMYLAQGSACSFDNVLCQSNYQGGVKIKIEPNTKWLDNLIFTSCYFENNGLYETTHEMFDGNYTVNVEGSNLNPRVYAGKIANINFIGGVWNKSPKIPSYHDSYRVVGSTNFYATLPLSIKPDTNNSIVYYRGDFIESVRVTTVEDTDFNYQIDLSQSYAVCVKNGGIASYNFKIVYNKNLDPDKYYANEQKWFSIKGFPFYIVDNIIQHLNLKITDTAGGEVFTTDSLFQSNYIYLGKTGVQLPSTGIIEGSFTLTLDSIS